MGRPRGDLAHPKHRLDLALNHPGILPPGVEWRRLDAGSYGLRIPGVVDEVRVTTQAEVFDDHFESHQFLSPGGSLFERIGSQCLIGEKTGEVASEGKVWMVKETTSQSCRFLVRKGGETVACDSLGSLIRAIGDSSALGTLAPSLVRSNEEAYLLA